MNGILTSARNRILGFVSHESRQGKPASGPGTQQLSGSQLHQLVKAGNRQAQLYARAKANGYNVKSSLAKSSNVGAGASVSLTETGRSAHEKDKRQKTVANIARLATAPTVIFAPIAAALQHWYFDPRDENKLKPFEVTDAVKAKIAQSKLKESSSVAANANKGMDAIASKYGVEEKAVTLWAEDYKKEIVLKVNRERFTPKEVAAAYGVTVDQVNAWVGVPTDARNKPSAALQNLLVAGAATSESVDVALHQIYAEEVVKNRFTPEAVARAYGVDVAEVNTAVLAYGAGISPRPAHKSAA